MAARPTEPQVLEPADEIIGLPEARRLAELEVPNIVRGQEPDGGWGNQPYDQWSKNSLKVSQALVNHGLFDQLRERPPLPADWRITRQIPARDGDLFTMTLDGEYLWVLDRETCEAIAVSPMDGSVRKRLKVPFEKPMGIGWWDDGLGVTQNGPKRLAELDPETGEVTRELALGKPDWTEVHDFAQVNGELWVSDGLNGLVARRKAGRLDEPKLLGLAGPEPISIAGTSDGVWQIDAFAPSIVKSNSEGELIDWGEKPFHGRCDGLAWDGESLWALDNEGQRICVIEKAE